MNKPHYPGCELGDNCNCDDIDNDECPETQLERDIERADYIRDCQRDEVYEQQEGESNE